MAWASKLGRAKISARSPQAAGMCDRCGFIFTHSSLRFQYDYAGTSLVNKQLLVCDSCMDRPQDQLRTIVIPADPVPILNPRPGDFAAQRVDRRITQDRDLRKTKEGDQRIVQKNGDDMLAPQVETKVRVTSDLSRRATQASDTRITQPLPITPPIPPRVLKRRVRVTDKGDVRTTVETDRRVTEPIEEK